MTPTSRCYTGALLASLLLPGAAAAGTIYGVKSLAPGGSVASSAPAALFSFSDTGPTSVTSIGTVALNAVAIDVDGLALSRNFGLTGFQIGGVEGARTSTLVSVNTADASATAIGATLVGRDLRGAMFDRQDRLWALDAQNNSLLRIDPLNGAVLSATGIALGGQPRAIGTGTDLAQAMDGTVYVAIYRAEASAFQEPALFVLDLDTGIATLAAVDSTPDPVAPSLPVFNIGLAAGGPDAPDTLFALDANGTEDVFRYDSPGFGRVTAALNILPAFNSGRGDLASLAPLDVPEPVSALLFATGIAGTVLARKRARRRG